MAKNTTPLQRRYGRARLHKELLCYWAGERKSYPCLHEFNLSRKEAERIEQKALTTARLLGCTTAEIWSPANAHQSARLDAAFARKGL